MAIDIEAADDLLTTTRSVRKRLDLGRPVPVQLVQECIEVALQAPTPTNSQNWAFLVVTDAEQKAVIADCYRRGMADLEANGYTTPPADPEKAGQFAEAVEAAKPIVLNKAWGRASVRLRELRRGTADVIAAPQLVE